MNQKSKHKIEVEVEWDKYTIGGETFHQVSLGSLGAVTVDEDGLTPLGISRPYEPQIDDVVQVTPLAVPSTYGNRIGWVTYVSPDSDIVNVDLGDRDVSFYKRTLIKIGERTR